MQSEIVNTILRIGAIAGAVTGIFALCVKIITTARKVIAWFKTLSENVEKLLKHDKAQYLSILRLTVMNDQIPLSERIAAGKEYIEEGGNGDIKHFYEQNLKPFDKINKEV